jgi:hypothetical protein
MEDVTNILKQSFNSNAIKNAANSYAGIGDTNTSNEISNTIKNNIKSIQTDLSEEDYDEFFDEISKEETKEATGAGSAGGFEAPLFSEPKKNNLFQPGTETKLTTKPKGGFVNEDEIEGGLADNKTVEDIAKKHRVDVNVIKKQLDMGVKVEREHTNNKERAIEIALDHLVEFPDYYDRLRKMEKRAKKEETKEATTSSSVGAYDAPFGGPKKDPLKLSNPDTVYKELRSVKDKNFPKLGGPGSTYVKVKDKCKTFPYCNQGDIKALEFFENNLVKEAIDNISSRFSLNKDYIKGVILENTNIYYKNTDMNKDIENMIDDIVEKVLSEEINKKTKQITESVKEEIDEMDEFYEIAKQRKMERMEAKKAKPDFLDLDDDGNKKESMKKASSDKKKKKTDEEVEEGNEFSGARAKAIEKGEDTFEVDGKTYPVKESVHLSEEEMIDLIEKIIYEEKIEGIKTQDSAMKQSKKDTDSYMNDLMKKFKDYLKDGSEGKFEMEPKHFPKGNGELKKMEKMAYTPSKGVEEYIDQIARSGGMENLEYDQIKPDEEWLDKNILGSSETGNSDEYANAVKTDANKKVKDRKDKNILAKLKAQSYNKAPQPVEDIAGHKTSDKEFAGIDVNESKNEKKKLKLNEDLERMKKLFSHNYKTQ